ncbi:MAG: hypothetical protein ACTS1Z_05170 [Parasphingopyxis sp.]|uniref:hypothetical protein n=1 Tax=Parasphingopyxis sp. TaxID=1920299 RepID=UPI003F9F2A1E
MKNETLDTRATQRRAFFPEGEETETVEMSGCKVDAITTNADGTTTVMIKRESDGTTELFVHPEDMTDAQLDEFKRAQDEDLYVAVEWKEEPGRKPIQRLTVSRD